MTTSPRARTRARLLVPAVAACLAALSACSTGSGAGSPTPARDAAPDTATAPVLDEAVLTGVLDRWAEEYPAAAASPVAVGVLSDDGDPLVVTGGVSGGAPDGAEVTPEDWFRFGSLAKTYVATAVLRLVERGEIDLDVPIATWVDGVPGADVVTTRQLLSHTSGLPDYLASPDWLPAVLAEPDRTWTTEEILALVGDADPRPAGFAYSNTNYIVAGMILEEVTGRPVREVIADEVLRPAGLSDTDMSSEGHPVVGGLTDPGDGVHVSTTSSPYTAVETSAGAAGSITGTVPDLLRFGQALLAGDLVSEDSWQQMTDFGAEGIYGLGVGDLGVISGGEIEGFGNYGEIPGFGALLVLAPDTGTVLVAVSGDDRASAFELGAVLQGALADARAGDPATGASATDPVDATSALFEGIDPAGPGCSVAVSRSGELVHTAAWGLADVESGDPMTPDTVVDIGSASKQFTATAALLLAERGDLDPDASVSTYVDGLPEWGTEVTVTDLIHHTSGIPDYIEGLLAGGAGLEEPSTVEDALAFLADAALTDAAGRHEYSNSNYLLLGEVVAEAAGADLATVVAEEIFAPAGMSAVMDPLAEIPGKAVSYVSDGGDWVVVDSAWSQVGDGGIQTTPGELARWGTQYWAPTVGSAGINEQRESGAVPTGEANDERYGAGIRYSDVPGLGRVVSHLGSWEAFITTVDVLPGQELAVAATCTSPDLSPVRPGIGLDLLRVWAAQG